jgi:hypothetical protein
MPDLAVAAEPAAKPWDCLAEVCLGDPGPETAGPARVAERTWYRTTEVCSEIVVAVVIETGWSSFYEGQPNWPSRSLPSLYYTEWKVPEEPKVYYNEIHKSLTEMGWTLDLFRDENSKIPYGREFVRGHTDSFARHSTRYGTRHTFFSYAVGSLTPRPYKEASVSITSIHPDYTALCAPKRQQGL